MVEREKIYRTINISVYLKDIEVSSAGAEVLTSRNLKIGFGTL